MKASRRTSEHTCAASAARQVHCCSLPLMVALTPLPFTRPPQVSLCASFPVPASSAPQVPLRHPAATSTNHLFCYRTFHTRRLVEQAHPRQVIATQRTNRAFWPSWLLSFNCVSPQLHVVYSNLSASATATLRLGLYISPMSLILRKMSCSTSCGRLTKARACARVLS